MLDTDESFANLTSSEDSSDNSRDMTDELDESLGIERVIDQDEANLWLELKDNKSFITTFVSSHNLEKSISTRTALTKLNEVHRLFNELQQMVPQKLKLITDKPLFNKAKQSWDKQRFDMTVWLDDVKESLDAIEENNAKVKARGNVAQKVKVANAAIAAVEKDVRAKLDAHTKDLPADLNASQCENMRHVIKDIQDQVDDIKKHYDDLIELQPNSEVTHTEEFYKKKQELTELVTALLCKVNKQLTSTPNNSVLENPALQAQLQRDLANQLANNTPEVNAQLQQTLTGLTGLTRKSTGLYGKRQHPIFDGDILKYPKWRNEWKKTVQTGLTPDDVLIILDDCTPDTMRLSYCENLEAAWKKLDDRYKNPAAVCSKLITAFLEYKPKSNA